MPIIFKKTNLIIALSSFSANICFAQTLGADLQREVARQESAELLAQSEWKSLLSFTSSLNSFGNGFIEEIIVNKKKGNPPGTFLSDLDNLFSELKANCGQENIKCLGYEPKKLFYAFDIDNKMIIDDSNYVVFELDYFLKPNLTKMQIFFQTFKMGISSEEVIWSNNADPYLRRKGEDDTLFSVTYRSVAKDNSPKPSMPRFANRDLNKKADSMMGMLGVAYNRAFVRRTLSPPTTAAREAPAFRDLEARNTQQVCSSNCYQAAKPPVIVAAFNSKGERISLISSVYKFDGLASMISNGRTTESMIYIQERDATAFIILIPKTKLVEIASFKVVKIP